MKLRQEALFLIPTFDSKGQQVLKFVAKAMEDNIIIIYRNLSVFKNMF